MDELYEYMSKKLEEMRERRTTSVSVDYVEFAKLYHLVCYMRQMKMLINGINLGDGK